MMLLLLLPLLWTVHLHAALLQLLETEILPALSESDSKSALRSLAGSYRRAAATAPTRPHSWLLNTDAGSVGGGIGGDQSGRSGRWVAAAMGAAGRVMKAPVRAGVALADAAADAAHYGAGHAPLKV